MSSYMTKRHPISPDGVAIDGSEVRNILDLKGGGVAHFELEPGKTSNAVAHHTVEEIWFFLNGRSEMWRRLGQNEEVVPVESGACVTIPMGTHF